MMSSTAADGSSDLSVDLDSSMSAGDGRHGMSLEELADSCGEHLDRPALGEASAGSMLNQYMMDEHMDLESTQLVTGEIRRLEECGARPLTELVQPITLSNALAYIASVELACICSPDVAINFLRSDVRTVPTCPLMGHPSCPSLTPSARLRARNCAPLQSMGDSINVGLMLEQFDAAESSGRSDVLAELGRFIVFLCTSPRVRPSPLYSMLFARAM